MNYDVLVPKLGFSMEEGRLAEWFVADGAIVRAGQPLYSLESEKSVEEIEAPASGRLTIRSRVGETYKVGHLLAEISSV
jgi:pyruvate/2-oxoglutarate dehydrogenase complex dihydrolipoamide acyltransferase (E2) component